MHHSSLLALIGLSGLLTSAAPAADPIKPVQTIKVAATERLDGTITLPNRNTLLLLTDTEKNPVRVVALSSTGQQLWSSSVVRASSPTGAPFVFKRTATWLYIESRASIVPLQVYSYGNRVFCTELITQKKNDLNLPVNQLVVQQIDENGKVLRHDFKLPNLLDKVDLNIVASYADADGIHLITKHTNHRQETTQYFLESYDPATQKSQQTELALPKLQPSKDKKYCYSDWSLAGHRNGKNYFYRVLNTSIDKRDNPNRSPIDFEFHVFDDTGHLINTFVTQLQAKLRPQTFINYSGRFDHAPSQGHAENAIEYQSGSNPASISTYDTFYVSAGGVGEVYLDPASEDIYILGEYGSKPYNVEEVPDLQGTYIAKLKTDGSLATVTQTEYPADVKADKKFLQYTYAAPRYISLFADPMTKEMVLHIDQDKRNYQVTYNTEGKLLNQSSKLEEFEHDSHNTWLIDSSYANAGNLGYPQVELPRYYTSTSEAYRKLKSVTDLAPPVITKKNIEAAQHSFVAWPDGKILVVRAKQKVGTPSVIDIFAL